MIHLITGVPGSGKTYFAVDLIYKEITSKNPKYSKIYTNINLNFDKCNKIKKDFVKSLNLDDLLKRIEEDYRLSKLFKNNQLVDEETGELITDYDSYVRGKLKLFEPYEHSLIILDECHLYFTDKQDPKMLRFLSYHRHFDIDMYLITQNKSLINRKYLAFIENLYVGVNPSKRFFSKQFVYKHFASYQEYKNNLVGKIKLNFNKKIASCYNSGSTKIYKSLSSKLIIPLIIGIVTIYFFFLAFRNYISCKNPFGCPVKTHQSTHKIHTEALSSTSKSPKNRQIKREKKEDFAQNYSLNITDYQYLYQLQCFKIKCIVNNEFSISYYLIKTLSNLSDTRIIYEIKTSMGRIVYLATNIDLSKFNNNQQFGGKDDEKDNNSIIPFNK